MKYLFVNNFVLLVLILIFKILSCLLFILLILKFYYCNYFMLLLLNISKNKEEKNIKY